MGGLQVADDFVSIFGDQIDPPTVFGDKSRPLLVGFCLGARENMTAPALGPKDSLSRRHLTPGEGTMTASIQSQESDTREGDISNPHNSTPIKNRTRASSLSSVRPKATPMVYQSLPGAIEIVGPR